MSFDGTVDFSGGLDEWVAELPSYQRATVTAMLQRAEPLDVAITWLQSATPDNTAPLGGFRTGASSFYGKLLEELQALLCSDDRYENERQDLLKTAHAGKATIAGAVSTAVAPHVGTSPVLLIPPIVITLALVGRASQAATCEQLASLIEKRSRDQ